MRAEYCQVIRFDTSLDRPDFYLNLLSRVNPYSNGTYPKGNSMQAYQKLESIFQQIKYYEHALTVLHWDQEVIMPPGGAEHRAKSMAELSALIHSRLCSNELKENLDAAKQSQLTQEQAANLKQITRLWQDANLIPEDLVRAESEAMSKCQHQWRSQRSANDWQGHSKNLKEVVDISRKIARIRREALGFSSDYDALLSMHCRGDSSELISQVFSELKTTIPEMLPKVMASQAQKPKVQGPFPEASQKRISEQVMHLLGFNFDCGRLDVSAHPFSTGNLQDQRITTRYKEDDLIESLYATIHETGHARYEAGLPKAWYGQPVGAACNVSIHESQSLFFEKHIGGSRAFCKLLLELVQKQFANFSAFTAEDFYHYVSWVDPGHIRVNADELTYPLHVILRYEIESALINGECEVDDIPELWDEKMQSYLGISTKDDFANGCMQDVHWPSAAFGYFPSYTLGAVNAAQLRAAFEKSVAPIEDLIAVGELERITDWLSENIWQHGSLMSSQELMLKATGEGTNARYLIEHFHKKYNI